MLRAFSIAFFSLVAATSTLAANELLNAHSKAVSNGNGSSAKFFKSIQAALDVLQPRCVFR